MPDLDRLLGFRYLQVGADRVELEWDVRPEPDQPSGSLHRRRALLRNRVRGQRRARRLGSARAARCVGVSNHTDFLQTVRSGTLRAVATPIHRGRSQQLWLVEVRDEGDRLVAHGQVRLQNAVDPDSSRVE